MGVGDERHLQGAVSRTERAAGLWSGVEPTTRSGRVRRDPLTGWAGLRLGVGEQSPSLCDAPPTQPGYPERLREVAPKPGAGVWTRGQSFSLSLSPESNPWTGLTGAGEG